ncbi:hypothetical protein SLE2022_103570 [Rubroshorea leprosula]
MDTNQSLRLRRLGSALRTVVACGIVGCTTLYGPGSVRHLLAFPTFSYVTTILIVSDATLGDALRGCWQALYASIQVLLPSMLILKVIGPAKFTPELAAVAAAVTAFLVALPVFTPLMTKQLAFGQTVIVYVGVVINGAETSVVMHPIHVALSTALGALAAVLAMLLPYPHLALSEVRRACRIYAENASQRLNLLVEAFSAQDNRVALDFLTEARDLAKTGVMLLENIRDKQEGIMWERPQLRFREPNQLDLGKKLQDMEILIRGMELSLTSCTSFPIGMIDEELRDLMQNSKVQIGSKLKQAKFSASFNAAMAPESRKEHTNRSSFIHKTFSTTEEDFRAFFFLNCMNLLQDGTAVTRSPKFPVLKEDKAKTKESIDTDKGKSCFKTIQGSVMAISMWLSSERMVFAFKCSISLGLAVLLGLIYNKNNGYLAGLIIATSFVTGRKATFTVANARAQGTAMGSIYGVICCFILHNLQHLRCLLLLPWIIFTSFLRHSRMYGQAGGKSAVLGALLILGRKNYGTPTEFAIARITEATIGLLCLIMVEILLQPARAATLAKTELSACLGALQDCIEGIVVCTRRKDVPDSESRRLRENQKKLALHVGKLENFVGEAELEPNFWFKPFHSGCYSRLLESLSKMVDILLFMASQIEFLAGVSPRLGAAWKELEQQINDNLELFVEKAGSSLKCFDGVLQIESLAKLEKEMQRRSVSPDIESGKPANADVSTNSGIEEDDVEDIAYSFLHHLMEVHNMILSTEGEAMIKSQMVLCLCGLGFCIRSFMRETIEIEKEIRELVKWDNPGRNINFHEVIGNLNTIHAK